MRRAFWRWACRLGIALAVCAHAPAAEPATQPGLSPEQEAALHGLLEHLSTLQRSEDGRQAARAWLDARIVEHEKATADRVARLRDLRAELESLEAQVQRDNEQLATLRLGRTLLAAASPTTQPASPAAQVVASRPADASPDVQFFATTVRPILLQHCFDCHGGKFRKAGLDLSTRDQLLLGGDSGPAIVPGRSRESLIYKLITYQQDPHMPAKAPRLPDAVIADIARWIDAGAPYDRPLGGARADAEQPPAHWAFRPPVRPEPPAVGNAGWVRNPIDAFILARLEREGITPSPEADRVTLIRRLSLDLLGLPPRPEEVDAFVQDTRPDAYGRLVDRLLASPHFGERWGRHWLDLARYADTDGYEKDEPRPFAWRWRDWVIDAMNCDMPFDQFTIEQLAGDLLEHPTIEQQVATGFHRNTLTNKEGGIDKEEDRIKAVKDRTSTTATVWLGLTVGCAECHSHKYDPISQREYYQLMAFFNSGQEIDKPAPLPGDVEAYTQAREKFDVEHERLRGELAAYERDELPARLAAWEAEQRSQGPRVWTAVEPLHMQSFEGATLTAGSDKSISVSGKNPSKDRYVVVAQTDRKTITGLRIEALADKRLGGGGPGRAGHGNFVLSEVHARLYSQQTPGREQVVKFVRARADIEQANGPWRAMDTIDGKPETGWAILPGAGKTHYLVLEPERPLRFDGPVMLAVTLDMNYGQQHTLGRFRISVAGAEHGLPLTDPPAEVVKILERDPTQRTPQEQEKVLQHFRKIDPELSRLIAAVTEHEKQAPPAPMAQMLAEHPNPPRTFIHIKGDFLRPGDPVEPGVLSVLNPLRPRGPKPDRLDLARWLVDPANPLTARVAVNRIWQHLFGQGLVTTPDDFGTRSEPPSHPELLDWLATELVACGWSQKAIIRLVVTSATYRQTSRLRPELLERDPRNVLLARQSRYRVEAEIIRDLSLSAGGVLNEAIGGPSIRPPLPGDVAALGYGGVRWPETTGPERFRRGMYIFFQRTVPYPMLVTFDAPDSNTACARRERSNTPLQSLTLLNDPVFFAAAQELGLRAMRLTATPADRIRYIFRACLSREPAPAELARLTQLFREIDELAAQDAASAERMLGEPQVRLVSAQVPQAAAYIMVARTVMNLDEFVTRE